MTIKNKLHLNLQTLKMMYKVTFQVNITSALTKELIKGLKMFDMPQRVRNTYKDTSERKRF